MTGNPNSTNQQGQLPSDLRSKIARAYVSDESFKDETGREVKYSRLNTEFVVDGETIRFAAKIKKNDKVLLKYAEDFSGGIPLQNS